jgi:hypothetical protein
MAAPMPAGPRRRLEQLREHVARLRSIDAPLTPVNMPGGIGSPANALAVK